MVSLFALFGPPVITIFLFAVGAIPYALWVSRRKPSRLVRWAVIGSVAAIAAYGAGSVYGLAFTNPLDVCADETGDGVYMDAGRDYTLTSVDVKSFPPSISCQWSSGYSTEVVWFWSSLLLYAGLACAVVCSIRLLVNRSKDRNGRLPQGMV
ncbi:hypothetical protein OKJ48_23250 [Streptomyces kunmingensis]|uniref:Integral membrane protein n=1 Tax=Streptomyces kunmingensis TaxID=68225 RepID=A0ABU6CF96_9ACTN|nr:hypothetical protein [Streptomyces kunmingensis]MEB3963139.1 hypothetical protein [Streptomyces kunmingensis]